MLLEVNNNLGNELGNVLDSPSSLLEFTNLLYLRVSYNVTILPKPNTASLPFVLVNPVSYRSTFSYGDFPLQGCAKILLHVNLAMQTGHLLF